MSINDFCVGQSISYRTAASLEVNERIAAVCGDYNAVHFSDTSAQRAGFQGIIAHALFCEGIISRLIGCELPGEGTIITEQHIFCKRPVYMGDEICTTVTIDKIELEKSKIVLTAQCVNQNGKTVMTAEIETVFRSVYEDAHSTY